jgi:hypothetical protein
MNSHRKLLKAFIRLVSVYWLIEMVFLIVNSPETLVMALTASHSAFPGAVMCRALSMCVRFFIYLALACGFWFFAEPLAKFVGKDLLKET